ncbi:MAG: VOC family protein [Oscillospiraceae bacterium]|jgi:catechol 2,3-dioxygenase-like lactoylglutathione lyase family enzyme|nr:VOC family protein [Oscillospiraceae bacterium]
MNFWHNGILTRDIDKTIDFLCAASDAPREKWSVMEIDFPQSNMANGDGGKLRAAFGRVGGVVTELLQPLDDKSYHAKALKLRGPGFHHIAYICDDDEQKEALTSIVSEGGRIVWEFRNGSERACYVEAGGGNAVLELINNCPFMPEE